MREDEVKEGSTKRGWSMKKGSAHDRGATPGASGQRILFTGPDGVGDYRARLSDFPHSIGVGPLSPEATGDLTYLYRAAPGASPPLPKQSYVGGVGWAVEYGSALNGTPLLSNRQFKLAEFRSALENRTPHRSHHPWQTPLCFLDRQQAGAHRRLPWSQSIYDNYSLDNKQSALSKRHAAQREQAEEPRLSGITFPAIGRVNGY
ncbi:protein SPMIP2 [Salminus brasiliensis]|uniref:protein SPMIP2 n=1 Tax=Salminus brasiliensis TaxID=930266 RepID=UPI003B833AC6